MECCCYLLKNVVVSVLLGARAHHFGGQDNNMQTMSSDPGIILECTLCYDSFD